MSARSNPARPVSDEIVLAVRLTAHEGQQDELRATLLRLTPPSRAEAGCIAYQMHADPSEPRAFLVYERWRDQAALDAHRATDHYTRWAPLLGPLVAERSVQRLRPIEP